MHITQAIKMRDALYCPWCDKIWVRVSGKLKPMIRKITKEGKNREFEWVMEKNENNNRRKRIRSKNKRV
jgi:hypothetical protein